MPPNSGVSTDSSSDVNCVASPIAFAAIWSIDVPASKSPPIVGLAWKPLMNAGAIRPCPPRGSPSRAIATGVVDPGQHQDVVLQRLQRRESRRQLIPGPLGRGHKVPGGGAVRDVDHGETLHRFGRRLRQRRHRGHHALEQRQRHGRTETAQHDPARDRLFGDDHDSVLRIWKGTLFVIPRMIDDQRWSVDAASRMICRTAGMS